jgi:hypothetical protein
MVSPNMGSKGVSGRTEFSAVFTVVTGRNMF